MHLTKWRFEFEDISAINSLTYFLIFVPKYFLLGSCFTLVDFYSNIHFKINNWDYANLCTIPSRKRSLFLSRNPSTKYSIYPGVCFMMNEFLMFVEFERGKCSWLSWDLRMFDKKSVSFTLYVQLSSNKLYILFVDVYNSSIILKLSVKFKFGIDNYNPSAFNIFFSWIKTCSKYIWWIF